MGAVMHPEYTDETSWSAPLPPPTPPACMLEHQASLSEWLGPSLGESETSSTGSLRDLEPEACEEQEEGLTFHRVAERSDGASEGCTADLINTLPSHLLLLILAKLDWASKRGAALVCHRWAALSSEPSEMWACIKLDFSWEGRHGPVRGQALTGWLNRRAAAVRSLSLLRSEPVLTCRAADSFAGVERFFHDFYPVPVEGMRALVAGLSGLQELAIEACNDLWIGNTWQAVGSLTSLTRLEMARLRKSILSHPTQFLSSLGQLASLRISCEDDWHPGWTVLPQFPPEIQALHQLTFLSLSSKGIKAVPPVISHLTALRDLRLCGCSLGGLPGEVSALHELTQLKLNSNPLGKGASGDPEHDKSLGCLPEGLSTLGSLQRVELMQCSLRAVPEAVLGLGRLQELMLGFNRIDRLPQDATALRGLTSLRHLSLFSNRLPSVPKAFSCLTALEELFLDDNLALEFPEPLDWALALPRLRCLSVVKDMEHIEEVPAHSWAHESLNHLLQLSSQLDEAPQEAKPPPSRRIVWLHHGYAAPLRDRAW